MKKQVSRARIWINSSLLLASVVLWLLLAPQQIGGQVAYILVRGISMQPNFNQDDLVVVRRSDVYEVGDVVAFHHKGIGTVIHRIIDTDGERFILQGDNNEDPDSYFPDNSEIIGLEWVHLPGIGKTMQQIRATPSTLAIFVGVMVFVGFFSIGVGVMPAAESPGKGFNREGTEVTYYQYHQREEWFSLIVFMTVLFAIGAWVVHQRPIERGSFNRIDYTQRVNFTYSAVAQGDVYDTKIVTSGEPIFRQLSDSVTVSVRYQLLAEQLDALSGSYELHAELRDRNGWKRTFDLLPQTTFDESTVDMAATISFAELQAIIANVQEQTGVERSFYQLRILPTFAVDGLVSNEPFADAFSAELIFEMSELEIRAILDPSDEGAGLQFSEIGNVQRPITVPNTMSFLSNEFSIVKLRQVTLIATGLGLLLIVGFLIDGWRWRRKVLNGQQPKPQHELVISAESDPLALSTNRIPLNTFEDLVRVAQHSGEVILEHQQRFAVHTGTVLYYFVPEVDSEPIADAATQGATA